MLEEVVLVNEKDESLGTMEKMEAHRQGVLHRAFSVFIFDRAGRLMLQQRAWHKYHSPGLWTNTCCSHPRLNEEVLDAASRRLQEEMGFVTPLFKVFDFIYKSDVGQGLVEHEFDHVILGQYDGEPGLNPEEAASWKWVDIDELTFDMESNPDQYTVWFRIAWPRLVRFLNPKLSEDEALQDQ